MARIITVMRKDSQLISLGDTIEFTSDGGMFKKGERAKVIQFGNDGKLFYYSGSLAISTDDERFKIIFVD